MITYIQLGSKGILNVKDDVSVPLTFSISDINDISKRQGGFSKSIILVGDSNNNNLLGHLFDVNIADSSFNVNKKEKCQIVQNGVAIFDGYLQLLSVNKLTPSQGNPDEFVEYVAQVKDDTRNFYASLQEKRLEDLPYWDQYNHIYTSSAITATSSHTVTDVYTYILPWNTTNLYRVLDFQPSIYAKAYWDRIFLDAGYTYDWESLQDCKFDKLIIPPNGDIARVNDVDYYVRAGFSGTSVDVTVTGGSKQILSSVTVTDSFQMIFDQDEGFPNYNPTNNYDNTTGVYTSFFQGAVNTKVKYDYSVKFIVPTDCQYRNQDQNVDVRVKLSQLFRLNDDIQNSIEYADIPVLSGASGTSYTFLTQGDYPITTGTTPELSSVINVINGDEITTDIQLDFVNQVYWWEAGLATFLPANLRPRIEVTYSINTGSTNQYIKFLPSGILGEGQSLVLKSFIPKEIKQKDFVSSIIKMFNLYITPDKYEDNHLIIQTRDEYYDGGEVLDWSSKFNIDKDVQLEFLPDLQDKRLVLSYKDDEDEWNKQYKLATSETYGQVQYQFDNDFALSTKRIELIFSPTPIVNANGLLVPAIKARTPKNNIRILYYDGWKDGEWNLGKPNTVDFLTLDSYPRALHTDNPITPSVDINFAEPDYLFYSDYIKVTNNNLYNKYWSRFVNQIETGKLLKGTFLLDEFDIHNLDLSSKIWVHDCLWVINKIIDYNPNGNGLTKVELISVEEGLKFAPVSVDREESPIIDDWAKGNQLNNLVSINNAPFVNTYGDSVFNTPVYGENNTIQSKSKNSIVFGNNNNYSGENSIVVGNDNNIQGDNLYVFGASEQTITGSSQAIFNVPVSATTISATTLYVNGSAEPIEPSVWAEGSAGNFSIKALNNSSTDATGNYAVAQGLNTSASGNNSHAEGIGTSASGINSHAEGSTSIASGIASHAEGVTSIASGNASHAQGSNTQATGPSSHAEGDETIASGTASHAEGFNTEASALGSHAGGVKSVAAFDGEWSQNSNVSSGAIIFNPGDTQYGTINTIGFTTDATPTVLDFTINGVAQNGWAPSIITSFTTVAVGFNFRIVCSRASGDSRLISGEGLIKWTSSGTIVTIVHQTNSNNGDAGLAGITAIPATSQGLVFLVTGLGGANLKWSVKVDYNY